MSDTSRHSQFTQPLNLASVGISRSGIESENSPVARLPAILVGLINRTNAETGCQVTFEATQMDCNSCKFKTGMKKMAAQVDICLFLNALLSENWHICANKRLFYLLTLRQKNDV